MENKTKAIILAGGNGTRMGSITQGIGRYGMGISKPLVHAFDKSTIFYPLSDIISAGIKDVLIITAPHNEGQFSQMIGDGSELGMSISYAQQPKQIGIADAFRIGKKFIGNDRVMLALGDNIFDGKRFSDTVKASVNQDGATIFALHHNNPEQMGVVEFNANGRAISLEEKPAKPKSEFVVPGMYFYDNSVVAFAEDLKPSLRGELEITDINNTYLKLGRLRVQELDRDTIWFDTGSPELLDDAASYIRTTQERTNRLIGSPEAEAYLVGNITSEQLLKLATPHRKATYGKRLEQLATHGWA